MNPSAVATSWRARLAAFLFSETDAPFHLRLLKFILLFGALYYILAFIVLAFYRIPFPFDLEWIEGAMVDQTRWVIDGERLYGPPTLDRVPSPYSALFFYIAAGFSRLFGVGPMPLRLISALSTLGCFILIHAFIKRESGDRLAGWLAAGFFASTVTLNAYWFDLARVDMLFIFLLFWGVYETRFGESRARGVWAGLLFTASFFIKQTALGIVLALLLYTLCVKRRFFWPLAVTFFGLTGLLLAVAQIVTEGWYLVYTMNVVTSHGLLEDRILSFWTDDLLKPLALPAALALFHLVGLIRLKDRASSLFFVLLLGATVAASYLGRLKAGGANNMLIPMHLALSVSVGLALVMPRRLFPETSPAARHMVSTYVYLLLLLVLACQLYSPGRFIPPKEAYRAGQKALSTLAEFKGDVWVVRSGNLTAQVGKPSMAHQVILTDMMKNGELADAYRPSISEPVESKRFDAIIVNKDKIPWYIEDELRSAYQRSNGHITVIRWQSDEGWTYSDEHIFLPIPDLDPSN